MAQAGDILMVEASADVERRMVWQISQPYLDPRIIVYDPVREFRSRQYQVWECICYDEPLTSQAATTPTGMELDSIENNASYDQGRLIYTHRETFAETSWSSWGSSISASLVAADGDCVMVESGAAHRQRWFYSIDQESGSFDYEYTPVSQTSERPYETWECRVIDDVALGQVAATPGGLYLVHWENVVGYDQGKRIWVHRDTFESAWTDWKPEIAPEIAP